MRSDLHITGVEGTHQQLPFKMQQTSYDIWSNLRKTLASPLVLLELKKTQKALLGPFTFFRETQLAIAYQFCCVCT
jgi:hypothetical protein